MSSVSGSGNPIQAQILSASSVSPAQTEAEVEKAKALASQDGNHNLIVVNTDDPNAHQVYNLKVQEMDLDQVALGQTVSTGKIQGTIRFMDNGNDDAIYNAMQAQKSEDKLYALSPEQAGKFVLALTVWGYGGKDDESKFNLDYSPRELKEFVSKFQEEIGAKATGNWDQETFAKAKEYVLNDFDKDEMMTDGQFKQFIGDLEHYYKGELNRDQVNENMEGYVYDQRKTPLNAPKVPDTAGFEAFKKTLKPADELYLALGLDDFEADEVQELMKAIEGKVSPDEAKEILTDSFDEETAAKILAPGADARTELRKVIMQEVQSDLDLPKAERSGQFDQKTYDAIQNMLKSDYELDLPQDKIRALSNQTLPKFIAVARGELAYEALENELDALAEQ